MRRDPNNSTNWHRLALLFYHLENREKALFTNNKALKILKEKGDYPPEGVLPFHLEAHVKLDAGENVCPILAEGLQHFPKDPLLNYLLAKTFIQDGRFKEAIPLCKQLIEQGRKQDFDQTVSHPLRIFDEYAFDMLGTCYFKLYEFSKAIVQYEKVFECSHAEEYRIKKELCEKMDAKN